MSHKSNSNGDFVLNSKNFQVVRMCGHHINNKTKIYTKIVNTFTNH